MKEKCIDPLAQFSQAIGETVAKEIDKKLTYKYPPGAPKERFRLGIIKKEPWEITMDELNEIILSKEPEHSLFKKNNMETNSNVMLLADTLLEIGASHSKMKQKYEDMKWERDRAQAELKDLEERKRKSEAAWNRQYDASIERVNETRAAIALLEEYLKSCKGKKATKLSNKVAEFIFNYEEGKKC